METELNERAGGLSMLEEDDADGQGWSTSDYYQSMGMTDDEENAENMSPDDFE